MALTFGDTDRERTKQEIYEQVKARAAKFLADPTNIGSLKETIILAMLEGYEMGMRRVAEKIEKIAVGL